MSGYVLRRIDRDGDSNPARPMYVAKDRLDQSYSPDLAEAHIYPTREAADRDRCKASEVVVALVDILPPTG